MELHKQSGYTRLKSLMAPAHLLLMFPTKVGTHFVLMRKMFFDFDDNDVQGFNNGYISHKIHPLLMRILKQKQSINKKKKDKEIVK